jgi:hypothetical protein
MPDESTWMRTIVSRPRTRGHRIVATVIGILVVAAAWFVLSARHPARAAPAKVPPAASAPGTPAGLPSAGAGR